MKNYLSFFHPRAPYTLVYMLQQVEYEPDKFAAWINQIPNLGRVQKRQSLVLTNKAKLLLAIAYACWIIPIAFGIWLMLTQSLMGVIFVGVTPIIVPTVLFIVALSGAKVILPLSRQKNLNSAQQIMSNHKGIVIAVLGSFGKTTMKEILLTVLAEGKKVVATPGNQNVLISQARWIDRSISGGEDVVIVEFGEGKPGDVEKMAQLVQPDYAIITGLAPNHLDDYGTVEAILSDFLSVLQVVQPNHTIAARTIEKVSSNEIPGIILFDETEALGWKISRQEISHHGVVFSMKKGKQTLELESSLLGRHQIPPLALAAALAHDLGLNKHEIEQGIKKTIPFEHRMQPHVISGAWIIDDTYNGNVEGIRAGLALLSELPAKRKLYVTPGLVEQGEQTEKVHKEVAALIFKASPDETILMANSATYIIHDELKRLDYAGKVTVESDPLHYYQNLEHQVAAGDLVLMQNDWTDNYS